MFDDEEAPDNVVKFLLLLDIAKVDDTERLSLATDNVDSPITVDETFKLFEESLWTVTVERFGDAALGFCVETTFSFSFRYDVIKS